MKLRNTHQSYGLITKLFHWLSAISIVSLFILGTWMVKLDYEHYWYDKAAHYHESIGIIIAAFFAARIIWRAVNVSPKVDTRLSLPERILANLVHRSLYLLCLLIFLTGYLIPTADGRGIDVFSWFTLPSLGQFHYQQADIAGKTHYWLGIGLMLLVLTHSVAACKHHFIDKDNTLKKIL